MNLLPSEDPPGIGAPIRTLTILINSKIIALLGLTTQVVSPKSPGFLAYLTRRARARKAPYTILTNQHDTLLLATTVRDGDKLSILKSIHQYPLSVNIQPISCPLLNTTI